MLIHGSSSSPTLRICKILKCSSLSTTRNRAMKILTAPFKTLKLLYLIICWFWGEQERFLVHFYFSLIEQLMLSAMYCICTLQCKIKIGCVTSPVCKAQCVFFLFLYKNVGRSKDNIPIKTLVCKLIFFFFSFNLPEGLLKTPVEMRIFWQ